MYLINYKYFLKKQKWPGHSLFIRVVCKKLFGGQIVVFGAVLESS
jgi:hypothetical protein